MSPATRNSVTGDGLAVWRSANADHREAFYASVRNEWREDIAEAVVEILRAAAVQEAHPSLVPATRVSGMKADCASCNGKGFVLKAHGGGYECPGCKAAEPEAKARPGMCAYCGHQIGSATCQAGHP